MKKIKAFLYIITLFMVSFTPSCTDVLDVKPLNEFSDVAVWSDPGLVESLINQIYFRLDEPATVGRTKANLVDEGHWRGYGDAKSFNNCAISQDQIPCFEKGTIYTSRYRKWEDMYKSVRWCNIFFENVNNVPFTNQADKNRMTGEVYFLRAYLYHSLTTLFGGVPILNKSFDLTDDFAVARNSYEDCVNFMVSDCDSAALLLPIVHSTGAKGRATKGAALALKARILLYAASDLYNTQVFSGYTNPELIGYTKGNRADRWRAAKNAAKAVMDLGVYSLYKAVPSPSDSVAQNISELFIAANTSEDIFVKYFTANMQQLLHKVSGPNGWHNWGTQAPIGEMVDEYEMKDGTKFDWNNPEHKANPYKNREPRFYSTIFYEGAKWKKRPSDVERLDPEGIVQVGKWEVWDSKTSSKKINYGLDTRQSPIENWNGAYTGYYLRKFLDPAVDAQYFYQTVPWRWIRYGEVLLNYAEACIELGEIDEGLNALNQIRTRAGMPGRQTTGQAQAREWYRHERKIELAFEEHRFYDVRRWVIGKDAYKPIHVVDVTYKLQPDNTTAAKPTITPYIFETWSWNDKAYFLPIMRTEMNRNTLLVQNPGY